MFRIKPLVCFAVVLLACHLLVNLSLQDEVNSSATSESINVSNQQETVKIGNTKTNNYNFAESNYQPIQTTSVTFNVGKLKKNKSRMMRPPTTEEYAIKKRIMDVYRTALDELHQLGLNVDASAHLEHLGRILKALNPKYIATMRVSDVAFADPYNTDLVVVAPETEREPTEDKQLSPDQSQCDQGPVLELRADGQVPIQVQLDSVAERFESAVTWDSAFEQELFQMLDEEFTPKQLAYRRLIQCLSHPGFCKHSKIQIQKVPSREDETSPNSMEEIDRLVAKASQLRQKNVAPPPPPPRFNEEPPRQPSAVHKRPQSAELHHGLYDDQPTVVPARGEPWQAPGNRPRKQEMDYNQDSYYQRPSQAMQYPAQQSRHPTQPRFTPNPNLAQYRPGPGPQRVSSPPVLAQNAAPEPRYNPYPYAHPRPDNRRRWNNRPVRN